MTSKYSTPFLHTFWEPLRTPTPPSVCAWRNRPTNGDLIPVSLTYYILNFSLHCMVHKEQGNAEKDFRRTGSVSDGPFMILILYLF